MGKAHSRSTVTGGTYILSGCVNARFWNSSEESLWRQEASAAAGGGGGGGGGGGVSTTRGSETRQHREEVDARRTLGQDGAHADNSQEKLKVGLEEDMCPFEVSLPPELGGSRCSVRVTTAKSENANEPTMSPTTNSSSQSPSKSKATIGAVDCDISLDAATDTQEWSFTLYDFEGHQKVTREDLTSLLKTISEALAKTVTLPASGRRKLKLSLSVVSDQDSETSSKQKFAFSNNQSKEVQAGVSSQVKSKRKHHHRHRVGEEEVEEDVGEVAHKTFPHHGKKKRERKQRRHQRSHSYGFADDVGWREEKGYNRRRSRNRRNNSSSTVSEAHVQNGANECKEEVTLQQQKSNFHPRENPERRTYYRELAGIENTSNSFTESDNLERLSRTLPDSKRQGRVKSCSHRRSKSCDRDSGNSNQEAATTQRNKPVSNGENLAGILVPKSEDTSSKPKKCQTVLAPGASPYTGHFGMQNLVIPLSACTSPVEGKRGKHKTKRHAVKPFTYMEHEIMGNIDGVLQVPMPTRHHHRHEHHHHHHHHHHYH
ncbi:uncharacterized protein [Apostichopus japonicus]|uniref:uncharacterized protein isoform X2 n=1 Tax=Stichopus japonicus TaxID=307972 RepID=UPI003AB3B5D0